MFQTYNTDFQVPDSAGTATALFSGVKTGMGVLGLDGTAKYNVCDTAVVEATRLETLLAPLISVPPLLVLSSSASEETSQALGLQEKLSSGQVSSYDVIQVAPSLFNSSKNVNC